MKVRLHISYDGTEFGGWQRQNHGPPTVQGTLEDVLSQFLEEPITLVGASRTDAGVHALGQVAHFKTQKDLSRYNLARAISTRTPRSLVVKDAWIAPDDFHATISATHKVYRYLIHNHETPSALRHRYTTWVRRYLDENELNRCAEYLVGEKDFKSFQCVGTPVKSTVRRIYRAQWTRPEPHLLQFEVVGNGFLKQMVRGLVGTQVELLQKGLPPEMMEEILTARDRRKAGATAPPQGLYLVSVHYPSALDSRCRKN